MSNGQKSRTRLRVSVHRLHVPQSAIQLLHLPVVDGPSGTNEVEY